MTLADDGCDGALMSLKSAVAAAAVLALLVATTRSSLLVHGLVAGASTVFGVVTRR